VSALASAKSSEELNAASPWFTVTPEFQKSLQPYTPSAKDAAYNLKCQLHYPKAALDNFCELLSEHSASFERAEE